MSLCKRRDHNSRTLPKFTSEIGLNTETGTAAEQTPAPSALGEAGKKFAERSP